MVSFYGAVFVLRLLKDEGGNFCQVKRVSIVYFWCEGKL